MKAQLPWYTNKYHHQNKSPAKILCQNYLKLLKADSTDMELKILPLDSQSCNQEAKTEAL